MTTDDCGVGNIRNGSNGASKELKREIEHQEALANVEHEQMRSATNELKNRQSEDIKHVHSKIADNSKAIHATIENIGKAMDSKHKFVLTILVTMLGTVMFMSFEGDQSLDQDMYNEVKNMEERIHEVEIALYDTRDITMQNDRLLGAIVRGDVLLSSEIEQDGRLLEIINAMIDGDIDD